MTRKPTITGPSSAIQLGLEVCEERAVPAHVGLRMSLDFHGMTITVETSAHHSDKSDKSDKSDRSEGHDSAPGLLKHWLEDNADLYGDLPSRALQSPTVPDERPTLSFTNAFTMLMAESGTVDVDSGMKARPKDGHGDGKDLAGSVARDDITTVHTSTDSHVARPGKKEEAEESHELRLGPVDIHARRGPVEDAPANAQSAISPSFSNDASGRSGRPVSLAEARPADIAVAGSLEIADSAEMALQRTPVIPDDADRPSEPAPCPPRWAAPALSRVTDLLSRFVPIDPQSAGESVDHFLDRLSLNGEAGGFGLTGRQASFAGAALAAGLMLGEYARRKRVPQRVSHFLSRSKFFYTTRTI